MDEYKSTTKNVVLTTSGIDTCTGFLAYVPGKIGYLAHISPYDKSYQTKNITNLVRQLIENSIYYDITSSKLKDIKIVIVANHLNSIKRIIHKLTSYGIFLSQIKFIYNPDFEYASMIYNHQNNQIDIFWHKRNSQNTYVQNLSGVSSLGQIIQKLGRYDPTNYQL